MRLAAYGAERDRPGGEAFDDRLRRLDLLQRYAPVAVELEVQQSTDRGEPPGLLVGGLLEHGIRVRVAGLRRVLEQPYRVRVVKMLLAGAAPQVKAADLKGEPAGQSRLRVRPAVVVQDVARDLLKADPLDTRRGPCEVLVHQFLRQPERLEYLCALVALERRDAHLGHHFQDALLDGLCEVVLGGRLVWEGSIFRLLMLTQSCDRLERQVRIDGRSAVAVKRREMMVLAWLAGLDDDVQFCPRILADQVMVDTANGEEGGDVGVCRVDAPVRKYDERKPFDHRLVGLGAYPVQRVPHSPGAIGDGEEGGYGRGPQSRQVERPDPGEVRVQQYRMIDP